MLTETSGKNTDCESVSFLFFFCVFSVFHLLTFCLDFSPRIGYSGVHGIPIDDYLTLHDSISSL
jgi:hypothetical protein